MPRSLTTNYPLCPLTVELESKAALKTCIGARAALSALREATALVPNPSVFINTLPLLEAQASSEIENIVTTTDELFRHAQLNTTAGLRSVRRPRCT